MAGVNIDKNAQRQAGRDIGFAPAPVDVAGIGNVTFGPGGAGASVTGAGPNVGISNLLQGQGREFLNAAGGAVPGISGLGQQQVGASQELLDEVRGFNPLDAAETRFNRLQGILDRGRNRQRDSAESRLLAQGRLGGEGGARQLEGQETAFADADAQLLDRMFGEAETARRGGIADALQLGTAGTGIGRGLAQDALSFEQSAANINNAGAGNLLQLLNAGAGLGSAKTQADIARAGAIADFNNTLINKGSDSGLGGVLSGLATGAATAFGGPLGGAAAKGITNLF